VKAYAQNAGMYSRGKHGSRIFRENERDGPVEALLKMALESMIRRVKGKGFLERVDRVDVFAVIHIFHNFFAVFAAR
jgi:hypothetical protein